MDTNLIIRPDSPGQLAERPGWLRAWAVGQVLNVQVLNSNQQGRAMLRVGAADVPVRTQVALEPGARHQVRVAQMDPMPVLKLLAPAQPLDIRAVSQAALQRFLPVQESLAPVLRDLVQIAAGERANIPAPVRQLAEQTLGQILDRGQLANPGALKQAVQNAGVFLEAKLGAVAAGQRQDLAGDLKVALLKVLRQVAQPKVRPGTLLPNSLPGAKAAGKGMADLLPMSNLPPPLRGSSPTPQPRVVPTVPLDMPQTEAIAALRKQVEGAVARVALHQVATAEQAQDGEVRWSLELPLRQGETVDVVPMHIGRDGSGQSGQHGEAWEVALALDLPGLRELHVRIGLRGERISVVFWAERADAAEQVSTNLERLRQSLTNQGLEVENLSCHEGCPPERPDAQDWRRRVIVDERV